MKKVSFVFFLILGCIRGFGQQTVSGYVQLEEPKSWKQSVFLIKIAVEDKSKNRIIATANIQEDGFFTFENAIFTEQNEIYRLSIKKNSSTGIPETSEIRSRPFIISSKDSLFFPKDAINFSSSITNSKADKEWQKLKRHEASSTYNITMGAEQYLQETRDYTKDSLQILLVKLLSIKTLDERKLLEKDIQENAAYYLNLLNELQESDLPPIYYSYLENKVRKAHHHIIERRYYTSLLFNGVGIFAVAGLLYLLFKMRKKKDLTPKVALSKQEENIKALIIEGKTNKEIATALFISISTVKTHITNIYSKLNISTRKELRLKS